MQSVLLTFLGLIIVSVEDKCIDAAEDNCKGETKVDDSSAHTNTGTGSGTAEHLAIGSQFTFCINLLQASGIPAEYCDVYCQFRYLAYRRHFRISLN